MACKQQSSGDYYHQDHDAADEIEKALDTATLAHKADGDSSIRPIKNTSLVRHKAFQEVNDFSDAELQTMSDTINHYKKSWRVNKRAVLHIMAGFRPHEQDDTAWRERRTTLLKALELVLPGCEGLMVVIALLRCFIGSEQTFTRAETQWMLYNSEEAYCKK